MVIKVININKNNQNKQHIVEPRGEQQEGGIIRIVPEGPMTLEIRTMQESHNANHALYYLSLMVYAITHGMKKNWSSQSKAVRIVAHLSSLFEFISDEEIKLKEAVNKLIDLLSASSLDTSKAWGLFLYKNWALFETLSHKYSCGNNNFSRKAHEKLGDVICGRKYVKAWWWKLTVEKLKTQFKKFFKEVKS